MSMGNVSLSKVQRWSQWLQIWGLYQTAFPRSERKPFGIIYKMARQGKSAVDPVFADAVREAGEILAAEDEQAVFLDALEEEQSELKELRSRLI